jgi:hypothetical protein
MISPSHLRLPFYHRVDPGGTLAVLVESIVELDDRVQSVGKGIAEQDAAADEQAVVTLAVVERMCLA